MQATFGRIRWQSDRPIVSYWSQIPYEYLVIKVLKERKVYGQFLKLPVCVA